VSGLLNSDLCGGPEAETRTELVQARFAAGARTLVGVQGCRTETRAPSLRFGAVYLFPCPRIRLQVYLPHVGYSFT
jgi:hypothetical protein